MNSPRSPRNRAIIRSIRGIVESAIDLGDRDSVLGPGKHADLPIGDMAGEDDHPPPGRHRPIDMLEAMRLDAPARFKDTYFP